MTTRSPFDDQPESCPHCNTRAIVPIIYRTPSAEMLIAQALGHIVVRDETAPAHPPEWKCLDPGCNQEF